MRMPQALLLAVAALGFAGVPQAAAGEEFDPRQLPLFTEGKTYLGQYETGLYPGGKNEMPAAHREAGLRLAGSISPLDREGKPDERDGRIVAVVKGHSNTTLSFTALQQLLKEHATELNERFVFVVGSVAGQPSDVEVQGQRDRLRQLWVEKVDLKSPWCDASGKVLRQYHKQRINIARCFIWLTPEFGEYLRQHAREKIERGLAHLNDIAPYWLNAAFEGTMGEGNLEHLYDLWLFQGLALVLGKSRDDLGQYLDVPAFARGDLYYILNLIATLEAGDPRNQARDRIGAIGNSAGGPEGNAPLEALFDRHLTRWGAPDTAPPSRKNPWTVPMHAPEAMP